MNIDLFFQFLMCYLFSSFAWETDGRDLACSWQTNESLKGFNTSKNYSFELKKEGAWQKDRGWPKKEDVLIWRKDAFWVLV